MVDGYHSTLSLRDTQRAIKYVKDTFQHELKPALRLQRISAPLFVSKDSGINDDLNGTERKVHFTIRETGTEAEVVQSLAKWKRMALYRYGFTAGEGLYTDMSAIRRDDDMDNIHSIYVDQWDWERVITPEQRNLEYLKHTVRKIVRAICAAHDKVQNEYPTLKNPLNEEVFFITSQELEDMYPELSPEQREAIIVKKHKTVFIMQIGAPLKSGVKHGGRAPDYDDWQLNGDLFFSIMPFLTNRLRSPRWVSALMPRVCTASSLRKIAPREKNSLTTRGIFKRHIAANYRRRHRSVKALPFAA